MTKKIINIKYKIVYISLLFIVINISCSSKDINSLFNKQIKDHKMVNYRKGNFTNSGNNEYIVFYTETKGIDRKTIYFAKTNIYIVNKNKIIKSYYLKSAFSLKYDKIDLNIINTDKINFGEWDGYCFVYDINNNGLNEIVIFSVDGIGLSVQIYEYINNEFKIVLSGSKDGNLTKIEMEKINSKNIIRLFGNTFVENKKLYSYLYRYAWNGRKSVYEVIEKRKEEVKWNKEKGILEVVK